MHSIKLRVPLGSGLPPEHPELIDLLQINRLHESHAHDVTKAFLLFKCSWGSQNVRGLEGGTALFASHVAALQERANALLVVDHLSTMASILLCGP